MKKIISIMAVAFTCLMLGCHNPPTSTPNTVPPALKIDDVLYYYTGNEASMEIDEDAIMGIITSTVSLTEIPTQNGQSNMTHLLGCSYAQYEENLIVRIEDKWMIFETRDVE